MTTNDDKSLLRCTWKKSADVLKKVVLYGSYVIVALTGITLAILIINTTVDLIYKTVFYILSTIGPCLVIISSMLTPVGIFLLIIPWYGYVGIVAVMAIPVYSLLWCITRELQDEDWKSDAATTFAFAAFAFAFATFAFAFALAAFALAVFAAFALAAFALAAFALAVFAAFALAAFALAPDSKVFLLPGAYMNYRKRMKAIKAGEQ
jgi:hypothetical protein